MAHGGKVRFAVVGQGWFAQEAVLPAFANATRNAELVALVSGDPKKRRELGDQYGVAGYAYEEYDELLASGKVDAVYIALPNDQHADYTERAARAGVHVLCEKPMAHTPAEGRRMIDACRAADVRLMIAYRLHFEPANMEAVDLIRGGLIGEPRLFTACNAQDVEAGNIRLDPSRGGGPLADIGIYCINAARYLFGAEPTEVTAFSASAAGDTRFLRVPEMVSVVLRFPGDRLAQFSCGFGEGKVSSWQVIGTKGDVRMDPGFTFSGERRRVVTVDGESETKEYPPADQVGPELVYFADCVQHGHEPEPGGQEGLADLHIIEAIEHALKSGHPVPVTALPDRQRPSGAQVITAPAVEKPDLVHAASPQG